jgi:hypothetical protein
VTVLTWLNSNTRGGVEAFTHKYSSSRLNAPFRLDELEMKNGAD